MYCEFKFVTKRDIYLEPEPDREREADLDCEDLLLESDPEPDHDLDRDLEMERDLLRLYLLRPLRLRSLLFCKKIYIHIVSKTDILRISKIVNSICSF